jgi:hypothetical protein
MPTETMIARVIDATHNSIFWMLGKNFESHTGVKAYKKTHPAMIKAPIPKCHTSAQSPANWEEKYNAWVFQGEPQHRHLHFFHQEQVAAILTAFGGAAAVGLAL